MTMQAMRSVHTTTKTKSIPSDIVVFLQTLYVIMVSSMRIIAWYGGPTEFVDVTTSLLDALGTNSDRQVLVHPSIFGQQCNLPESHLRILNHHAIIRRFANGTIVTRDIVFYPDMHEPLHMSPLLPDYSLLLSGLRGLEVGGPSPSLTGIGIYKAPSAIDNIVFAEKTLWETHIDREPFQKDIPGVTRIGDVVDMMCFQDESYQFVFASHVLEHLVNPLKALNEIKRVLCRRGVCILVLPWKHGTFDHRRETTTIGELLRHYVDNRNEHDVSDQIQHILEKYDFDRDPGVRSIDEFVERCDQHRWNRALHVHVFDFRLIRACMACVGFDIIDMQLVAPYHQIVVGRKRC